MSELENVEAKAFLGTEFLTWLWARHKLEQFTFGDIEATLQGPFVLSAKHGNAREIVVKGDVPEEAPEAIRALYEGKRLARCKIRLRNEKEGLDWTFALAGETMAVSGLKLAKMGKLAMEIGLPTRVRELGQCQEMLKAVYKAFITLRMNKKAWKKEINQIRSWVGEAA